MVPADSSAEAFENILKTLPTIPGGVSVEREVRARVALMTLIDKIGHLTLSDLPPSSRFDTKCS